MLLLGWSIKVSPLPVCVETAYRCQLHTWCVDQTSRRKSNVLSLTPLPSHLLQCPLTHSNALSLAAMSTAVVEDAEAGLFTDHTADEDVAGPDDTASGWSGAPAPLPSGDQLGLEEEAARKGYGKLYAIFNGGLEGLRACAAGARVDTLLACVVNECHASSNLAVVHTLSLHPLSKTLACICHAFMH